MNEAFRWRSANALTTRCQFDGQQAYLRPRKADWDTLGGGENCSSRVQEDAPPNDAILLSDDLLGWIHMPERAHVEE
jgi:hypothetical protein